MQIDVVRMKMSEKKTLSQGRMRKKRPSQICFPQPHALQITSEKSRALDLSTFGTQTLEVTNEISTELIQLNIFPRLLIPAAEFQKTLYLKHGCHHDEDGG